MPQPTSPVTPGAYNFDVALTAASQVYLSVDGAGATTLFGNGAGPGGGTVTMTAQGETLGGQNAGFTIYEDQQDQSAVDVTASGAVIQGNTLLANAAYTGTGDFPDNFDLYAPSAGTITVGGSSPGEGNTFGGVAPYLAFLDGSTVDVTGNLFNGAAEFVDLDTGGSQVLIQGNTFTGNTGNSYDAAVQAGLQPNSFVTYADANYGWNLKPDQASSYTINDNNFDGFTGNDIIDVLASYTFVGSSAQRSFTGTVNANGIETDTISDWQPSDTLTLNPTSGLYSVAAVHQNGPDEVQIFLQAGTAPNQTLTGDQIVLENVGGVSATQVATMLGNAPIADGPVANNGLYLAGPSATLDLSNFVAGLYYGGAGSGDDRDPRLVAVGTVSPSGAGSLIDNDGSITFLTPSTGGTGTFTYTVEDEYGDLAQGTVTVDTDPGPTAHMAPVEIGHGQSDVNLTNQIFKYVTVGQLLDHTKIVAVNTSLYDTTGTVDLSNGQLTYTPGATNAGYDYFGYTVEDKYGQTATSDVYVYIDPGPKLGTVQATVTATPTSPTDLTSAIMNHVDPGASGDKETLTGVGTVGTLGSVSLSNGHISYTATGTTPQNEMTILSEIDANGKATDSFTATVTDQVGDSATGTVDLTLKPFLLDNATFNGQTLYETEPTQLITDSLIDDTIDTNGHNDAIVGAGLDTFNLGAGDAVVNMRSGQDQTVNGSNGWVDVVNGGPNATITLGNGVDNVTASGASDVQLGNGNDTVTLSGGGSTAKLGNGNDNVNVNGTGNTVTLGTGTDLVQMGALPNGGGDRFQLNGSNAQLFLTGTKDKVFVSGGSDYIADTNLPQNGPGDALSLNINATGGTVDIIDFSTGSYDGFTDAKGVISIAHQLIDGGVLGASPTTAQIASYMNSHGATLSFVNGLGSLHIGAPTELFSAANFRIT